MDYKEKIPLIVYDNQCYLCVKFAKIIHFFARGKITMIGHYSSLGQNIRDEILDNSALEMFWFINEKNAFGGRAALLPLLNAIFTSKRKKSISIIVDDKCEQDCKSAKAVFIRSASLFSNSKTIKIS